MNSSLSGSFNLILNKSITQQLADDDDKRDKAFIALRDYARAFTHAPDEQMCAAAILLVELISKHGWTLYDEGYQVETAQLMSLFKELEKPEYATAINTINAQEFLENLVEKQRIFEASVMNAK